MNNNELKFVNDRCKANFEKAFAKIARCCGIDEKVKNAGAAEEFQDFMLSLERFYLRKMNHKQKHINKFVRKLKEKDLPKNAVIIDGTIYTYEYIVTKGYPCDSCDLNSCCLNLPEAQLCSIFEIGADGDVCFKKKGGDE